MFRDHGLLREIISKLPDKVAQWRANKAVADRYHRKTQIFVAIMICGLLGVPLAFVVAVMKREFTDPVFFFGLGSVMLVIFAIVQLVRLGSYKALPSSPNYDPDLVRAFLDFLVALAERTGESCPTKVQAVRSSLSSDFQVTDVKKLMRLGSSDNDGSLFHRSSGRDDGFYEYPREETRLNTLMDCEILVSDGHSLRFLLERESRVRIDSYLEYPHGKKKAGVTRYADSEIFVRDTYRIFSESKGPLLPQPKVESLRLDSFEVLEPPSVVRICGDKTEMRFVLKGSMRRLSYTPFLEALDALPS